MAHPTATLGIAEKRSKGGWCNRHSNQANHHADNDHQAQYVKDFFVA
jgi:hypothetical protein